MKVYKVTQDSPIANPIVKELNAAVLPLTFTFSNQVAIGSGIVRRAELWDCSPNASRVLIARMACPPIHSTFVGFYNIEF